MSSVEREPFPIARESSSVHLAAKWRDIERRLRDDAVMVSQCTADAEACSVEAVRFQTIVDGARDRHGRARLGEINRAVNLAIRPASDMARFGEADRWVSPLETLAAGRGDCEDYAILKFAALMAAGMPASDLRLVVVRDPASRTDHAVVAARLDARWLILDNRRFAMMDVVDIRYQPLAVMAQTDNGTREPTVMADAVMPDAGDADDAAASLL